jgi:hypothetical protein
MDSRRALVCVSSLQLAAGVAGQLLAIRDRRPFDVPLVGMRGSPERVGRDSWLNGTGISAPVTMMACQAVATARLASGPSLAATRVLTGLGVAMTAGYLAEREFGSLLSPAGWRPSVSLVAATGLGSAVAMGVIGWSGARPPVAAYVLEDRFVPSGWLWRTLTHRSPDERV